MNEPTPRARKNPILITSAMPSRERQSVKEVAPVAFASTCILPWHGAAAYFCRHRLLPRKWPILYRPLIQTPFSHQHAPPFFKSAISEHTPPSPSNPEESYLQCPQCKALYQVDAFELDNPPRVVACSACLHEWYASEEALLWGDEAALQALSFSSKEISIKQNANSPRRDWPDFSNRSQSKRYANDKSSPAFNSSSKSAGSNGADEKTSNRSTRSSRLTNSYENDDSKDAVSSISDSSFELSDNDDGFSDALFQHDSQLAEDSETDSEASKVSDDTESQENDDTNDSNLFEKSGTPKRGRNSNVNYAKEKTSMSIFVGNLSFRATEEDLYRAFSGYGLVLNCQVPLDSCGASKGFGFVVMRERVDGMKAIEALHGTSILGRDITLTEAHDRYKSRRPRGVYSTFDGRRKSQTGDRRSTDRRPIDRKDYDARNKGRQQEGRRYGVYRGDGQSSSDGSDQDNRRYNQESKDSSP